MRGIARAWLAVLLLVGAGDVAADVRPCARVVFADPLADPGSMSPDGAIIDVDPLEPADTNQTTVGGIGPTRFLAHLAVGDDREIFVSDMEADPSGLGPDPNGNSGRGAVFQLERSTGNLLVLSDGTDCGGSISNCGPGGAFVDPIGLAWGYRSSQLVVADLDADPSGFGPDTLGFGGHGAIFAVSPVTGGVDLVADGSLYPDPIPTGAPTIFEDPLAVAFGRDGMLYVVDQLAEPTAFRNPGAVFRVDPATGAVELVSAFPQSRGLRDVAVEPGGTLLVLDRIAGGRGTLFRIDPALPPTDNVVGSFTSPMFVEPQGLVVEGNGSIYVIDASADPLDTGTGAIFLVDPALSGVTPLSSTNLQASSWALDLLEPESLDGVLPAGADAGTSLTVVVSGGLYDADAMVSFGPEILVDAVRVLSPMLLEADITIPPNATPGPVDVSVTNAVASTKAFHCELFDIYPGGGLGCTPATPIGDSLRVTKSGTDILLTWSGSGDACATSYRVRRADSPWPAALPPDWPVDPAFLDITPLDLDASPLDASYLSLPLAGQPEYFLVTEIGSNGLEGPSGHYGR